MIGGLACSASSRVTLAVPREKVERRVARIDIDGLIEHSTSACEPPIRRLPVRDGAEVEFLRNGVLSATGARSRRGIRRSRASSRMTGNACCIAARDRAQHVGSSRLYLATHGRFMSDTHRESSREPTRRARPPFGAAFAARDDHGALC